MGTTAMQIISPGHLTRREWAKRLNAQWDHIRETAVDGFVQLGRDLHEAKAQLAKDGKWLVLLKNDLKFQPRQAQMLMKIARWAEIRGNASYLRILPPDYTTMHEITQLDLITFKRLVKDGTICPTLQRNEVAKILRFLKVSADEQRVLNLVPIVGRFLTLVIDPPWKYDMEFLGRGAPSYATMSVEELSVLDVGAWADPRGCHLYLWSTTAMLEHAFKLMAAWEFRYKTILTWDKGKIGLGTDFRNQTEHVLFGTRGDLPVRDAAHSISTLFEAPAGEHLEKPEVFYDIVRAASYPPFGEAFQRTPRPDFINLFREKTLEAAE